MSGVKTINKESRIKLRIKNVAYEIEIEALKDDLSVAMESINKLKDLLSTFEKRQEVPTSRTEALGETKEDIPQIAQTSKLTDAIQELLQTNWGKTPRTLKEIDEALKINALHYEITTIAPSLLKLTKKGILRRIKKGDIYSYVVSSK